jgi:tetratricopeptide (TPR) repeat protein
MIQRSLFLCAAAALTGNALIAQNERPAESAHAAHAQSHAAAPGATVPLYDHLGTLHYRVTTRVPAAQAYFDQGLRLYWAFNHAEAERAFLEAERLDPQCAMCVFGAALSLGPNINAPMDSATGVRAREVAARAARIARGGDARERAMIAALERRYSGSLSREAADSAWADAIGALADRYPDDLELQALHAEALMDLSPWHYWEKDGSARPATPVILRRLEGIIAQEPNHPGACHLFIHAVEAREPERAVPCAERLAALMPGAGHLVHMPGHIYIRVGRYRDAIEANRHAVHADEGYLEGPGVMRQGLYGLAYYPHNWHFMSFAAAMAGQQKVAIEAARQVVANVGWEVARQQPWVEAVTPIVWWTLATFGRWDEILAEPLPPTDIRYTTGMAYYARGLAFAAKRRWAEALAAADSAAAVAKEMPEGDNRTAMRIASLSVRGEVALRQGKAAEAVRIFREAAELESSIGYMEPPTWYYPVRQSLGKALLAAGDAAAAERAYREDLERFPENGWSLKGLELSLARQGKHAEAREVAARFAKAWEGADVTITASRF